MKEKIIYLLNFAGVGAVLAFFLLNHFYFDWSETITIITALTLGAGLGLNIYQAKLFKEQTNYIKNQTSILISETDAEYRPYIKLGGFGYSGNKMDLSVINAKNRRIDIFDITMVNDENLSLTIDKQKFPFTIEAGNKMDYKILSRIDDNPKNIININQSELHMDVQNELYQIYRLNFSLVSQRLISIRRV